jgi:hypothetical protein
MTAIFAGGFAAGIAFTIAVLFLAVLWFARPRHYADQEIADQISNGERPAVAGAFDVQERRG